MLVEYGGEWLVCIGDVGLCLIVVYCWVWDVFYVDVGGCVVIG